VVDQATGEVRGLSEIVEIESVREFRPELADAIERYHRFAASFVDPTLVALYRLRIGQIQGKLPGALAQTEATRAAAVTDGQLRDLAAWPDSDQFDARQKACLELAEYFCHTAQGVTDEQIERLHEHLSYGEILALTSGLWVADASGRFSTYLSTLGLTR
jgi:hypothetical protein